MGPCGAATEERRSDPRVTPTGLVRIAPLQQGAAVEGTLVDVSAGGLRASGVDGVPSGARLRIEVRLVDTDLPKGPPRLVLEGTGRVVWRRDRQMGLAFEAPLRVQRPFPEVQIF